MTAADVVTRPLVRAARERCEQLVFRAQQGVADEGLVIERALDAYGQIVATETLRALQERTR